MADARKTKNSNLLPIPGHPGLYTPIIVTRNPKKEKALLEKIMRDADKLTAERHAREALFMPKKRPIRLRAAFPFL